MPSIIVLPEYKNYVPFEVEPANQALIGPCEVILVGTYIVNSVNSL